MTAPEPVIRFALISVSDKTGVVEFARDLAEMGVGLISTGGTAATLAAAGLCVVTVETLTGFPEMLDGRVKTLHPRVHAGLLAKRGDAAHAEALALNGIAEICLLAVNLYPFEAAAASGASFDDCVETIDVGGPAMIRAAAKNHDRVTVATDAADYPRIIAEMRATGGSTSLATRRALAAKAFVRTAAYDSAIASWFAGQNGDETPATLTISGSRITTLSYGENPHQRAAFYASGEARFGVATARLVQGKALSYNNINDTDAAYELASEFAPACAAAAVIVKHANPCGVALAPTLAEAYRRALACDPVSAFGGVIALNRRLDAPTAAEIVKLFTEVVIAPDADEDAVAIMAGKKNLRLLLAGGLPARGGGLHVRSVAGGFLAQTRDDARLDAANLRIVTKRAPTERELADMLFAFTVCKFVKSNAIVFAKDGATVGVGAGQMSRVDAARIAVWKAQEAARLAGSAEPLTHGSAAASDAFFPFADGLIALADAGAAAVIQPGGSLRDDDVIAAADERGLAMAFTGVRHFRH
ncbi:MAG: bifunctional phosphoribosylaminoimidazolecarboxamide formyltransferase/IMP cyclohydrolase [Hyphomicrobiales bacterium]|nr:bifunctional phosphoribosylaminoimidazolecarboxamide formyltransferase/IMP cyclohydrolase [Hyphomicrobiales bacterium]